MWINDHGTVPGGYPYYAKYGGQTMTLTNPTQLAANTFNGIDFSAFYLINPPTGEQTVTFYTNAFYETPYSNARVCYAVSYNGVRSVGSYAESSYDNATGSSSTFTLTTTEAEDWMIAFGGNGYFGSVPTAGTNAFLRRNTETANYGSYIVDSNGPFASVGSNSMTVTFSPSRYASSTGFTLMHALPTAAAALNPCFSDVF